jgi:predicted acylesterase/phospholipase RssA
MSKPIPPPQIALAFGSSFMGFAAHFGFLCELLKAGHQPVAIAGSSSGAIVAGLYAAGLDLAQMEEAFMRRNPRGYFCEWRLPFRAVGMLLGWRGVPAILEGKNLRRLLVELVGERRIEDCTRVRLHLAVTNLCTHQVELRDHGPLVDTILASCAQPGMIAPRRVEGQLLWDGGLSNSVPIEMWIDDPTITHIVAHSLLHEHTVRARKHCEHYNFAGAMMAGHQLTADELLRWKAELARRAGKTVHTIETITPRPRFCIPLTPPPPKPWPDHARDLMEFGAVSARKLLLTL